MTVKALAVPIIGGMLLLALCANAQYFGNSTSKTVCTHDSPDCHPVSSGELFAVISIFTLWPWLILLAFVLYKASDSECEACSCVSAMFARTRRAADASVHRTTPPADEAATAGGATATSDLESRSGTRRRGSSGPSGRSAMRKPADTSEEPSSSDSPAGRDGVRTATSTGASPRGSAPAAPVAPGGFRADTFATARSTSLASKRGAASFMDADASPPRPFNALGGSLELSSGTVVFATSRLAALGVSCGVPSGERARWEMKLLTDPTGPLCMGVLNSKRRAVNEVRKELVGTVVGSWGFDVATGNSLAETDHSGIPPLETFAATKGTKGDIFGVELDRAKRKITLYKNSECLRVELQGLPEDGELFPAFSVSGGSMVQLRLGHGWGNVGTMVGATSAPVGMLMGEGTSST